MPIKRKASATSLVAEPPARRLRSGGSAAETSPGEPRPAKRRTRALAAPAAAAPLPKRVGRPPSKAKASTSTSAETRSKPARRGPPGVPAAELAVASSSTDNNTQITRAKPNTAEQKPRSSARIAKLPPSKVARKPQSQVKPAEPSDNESDTDELNIMPAVAESSRPSTPSRPTGKLVYVEIPTPRLARMLQAAASPMSTPRKSTPLPKSRPQLVFPPSPGLSHPSIQAFTFRKSASVETASLPPKSPAKRPQVAFPTSPILPDPSIQAFTTPSKKHSIQTPLSSPTRLPITLPVHLHSCLAAQKRAIMQALRNPPDVVEDEDNDSISTNAIAYEDLCNLLNGTVNRGEGNSCLLIGPRGSGKTRVSKILFIRRFFLTNFTAG